MKAIICDRCGKVTAEGLCATIEFPYGTLGEPDEQHLCDECRKKLIEWIRMNT